MKQININLNSQTYMSHYFVPRFLKRQDRSAIINVSSINHYNPGAIMPIYSATKSYNFSLSLAMHEAYKNQIDVMAVTPGAVITQLNPGIGVMLISAERHARETINHLGWQTVTYGSFAHAIQPRLKSIAPIGYMMDELARRRMAQFAA